MPPFASGLNADLLSEVQDAVSDVFDSESVIMGKEGEPLVKMLGSFSVPPDTAYQELKPRLKELHLTALFRRDGGKQSISIMPGTTPISLGSNKLNVVLLILTLFSTLFVGTMMVSPNIADFINRPWLGLPFALSLMVILGAHELGHYFAARQYDVPVSLPYFIPMPLGPFGTLGAFISMKAPPPNRRALLTIATAGPLSGFVLAVPILLLGLSMSPITPLTAGEGVVMEGNSILYALFKIVTFGRFLPSGGEDVLLHPVAFAGWAGLLVTALNLIPVGQLDGGHILYSLMGEKSRHMIWPVVVILIGLGTLWSGWFLWVVLVLLLGRQYAAPLDDLTTLTPQQRITGWLVLALFVMIFTPLPLTVY
jgi:membrane-associated protease RseP (regulator of RpoE activity)